MYQELGRDIDFKVFGRTLSEGSAGRDKAAAAAPGTAPRRGRARYSGRGSRSFVCSRSRARPTSERSPTSNSARNQRAPPKLPSPSSIPRLSGLSARRNPRERFGAMTAALRSQRFISDFIFPLFLPLVLVPYVQYLPAPCVRLPWVILKYNADLSLHFKINSTREG